MRKSLTTAAILALALTGCSNSEQAQPNPSFSVEKPIVCAQISELSEASQIRQTQLSVAEQTQSSSSTTQLQLTDADLEITQPGTYSISGTSNGGRVIVNSTANGKVHLIFSGISITSTTHNAVEILAAAEIEIELVSGSVNTLTSTESAAVLADEETAVLFSRPDLIISGTGTLEINSEAADGISSRDGLIINSGTYNLQVKDEGIQAKDFIQINDGTFNINSTGDALRTTNEESAKTGWIDIQGGTFSISTESDAIQAESNILLENAELVVNSKDDAINANCFIWLNSQIQITSVDDGIHSDTAIALAGGSISILNAYEGIETERLWIYGGEHQINTSNDGINLIMKNLDPTADEEINDFSEDVFLHQSGGRMVVNSMVDGVDVSGNLIMTGGELISWGTDGGGNNPLDLSGSFEVSNAIFAAFSSSDRELIKYSKYRENEVASQAALIFQTDIKQPAESVAFKNSNGEIFYTVPAPTNWLFAYVTHPDIEPNQTYYLSSVNFPELKLVPNKRSLSAVD